MAHRAFDPAQIVNCDRLCYPKVGRRAGWQASVTTGAVGRVAGADRSSGQAQADLWETDMEAIYYIAPTVAMAAYAMLMGVVLMG